MEGGSRVAGIYKARAGLRVGGPRWSSSFKSSKAFGLCGYGTTSGGTHAKVYYLHSYSRVQFALKNLSEIFPLANPKRFCEQQVLYQSTPRYFL